MLKKRLLQALMAALGVILLIRFAAPGIISGGEPYADDGVVDVLLDSEFRFLSVLAGSIGVAFLWMIPRIERYAALLTILAAGSFAGGMARLLSMAQHGLPPNKAVIAAGIELVVPLVALVLLWWMGTDRDRKAS